MEASVFQAPGGLSRTRVSIALTPLRLRSDEQLVASFRRGHDEAFRAIYDRYHKRLLAYARQMLPLRQDAEDVLQDVFVRAFFGLRAHDRDLALRAWLFRVAHNRCIDELRRPVPPPPEVLEMLRSTVQDPVAEVESREVLRRLIADVRRLPEQQRSALLLRELDGMAYEDLAATLEVTVPAVKSLLVRARVGLARASEARDTSCAVIREELVGAHDQGVRPNALARRHMHDCPSCRSFRGELRGMSRELRALVPTLGPLAALARLWGGLGGAGRLSRNAGSGSGAGASGGTVGTLGAGGSASSAGMTVGINHLAALIAAAAATGGAVEIQHTLAPQSVSPPQSNVRPAGPPGATTPLSQIILRSANVAATTGSPPASSLENGNVQPSSAQGPTALPAKPPPRSTGSPQALGASSTPAPVAPSSGTTSGLNPTSSLDIPPIATVGAQPGSGEDSGSSNPTPGTSSLGSGNSSGVSQTKPDSESASDSAAPSSGAHDTSSGNPESSGSAATPSSSSN